MLGLLVGLAPTERPVAGIYARFLTRAAAAVNCAARQDRAKRGARGLDGARMQVRSPRDRQGRDAMTDFLETSKGRKIAYAASAGNGPGVVFLGGFMSDMQGTKAVALEAWAQARGLGFLRLDYSGHGESEGRFEDGCIGDWAADAQEAIETLTDGPIILVGSSMGGWISLLLAGRLGKRIAGLVGIAAAPDFTEDTMWESFSQIEQAKLMREGRIFVPSDYDSPYPVTKRLIEEGRDHLVLRRPLELPFAVRLLHGTADADVPMSRPLALLDHAICADMRLTFVKGADHRFSTPECLTLIEQSVAELVALAG